MGMMFAIIQTGGKQYQVREGENLLVEKLELNAGDTLELDVLLLADEEGKEVKVGTPVVSGAKVKATVLAQTKGEKIEIIKYKPKVRYRRHNGHRQSYTEIKIEKIVA